MSPHPNTPDAVLGGSLIAYWLGIIPPVLAAIASVMAITWYGILIYNHIQGKKN